MAKQIIKYCPVCREEQFFEWQIEREDLEVNNKEYWLMCCACGYVTNPD